MHIGEQEVIQEGTPGLVSVEEEILYQDGKEIKSKLLVRMILNGWYRQSSKKVHEMW